MTPSPSATSADWLAEGFAVHVARWAAERNAPEAAVRAAGHAARQVSIAMSEGRVCIHLGELADSLAESSTAAILRPLLLASGIVGTAQAPGSSPLILDAEGRLYLHRYFDYERRLARRLTLPPVAPPAPDAGVKALLERLFASNAARLGDRADWQKIAAALALDSPLTIISGGPGTGKTTTVVNLLACLLEQNPACRIALAAPTGKAAARMLEAIRLRAAQLPPEIRSALPIEAFTIHRLLGVMPGGFRHGADNRLAIDALIVDEASMLDLALATRLFEAVPDAARIVLLGDKDQLAAVESGAIFAELSCDPTLSEPCIARLAAWCDLSVDAIEPPPAALPNGLPDSTVWFSENFRFAGDSGIGRLAADVRAGRAAPALAWLRGKADPSVEWIEDSSPLAHDASMRRITRGYAGYIDALRHDPGDALAVTAAFGRFRALCALREGPRGVAAVNALVGRHVRQALQPAEASAGSPWYPGRAVMVLRNDPVMKLFNGDIGIALPDDSGQLMVCFPDAALGLRRVAPLRLPPHRTAFAMTVHKAQGSEFDAVLLMLPSEPSRVLSRELLYTALTRARVRATIIGGAEVLTQAIETAAERHSGLIARLREAGQSRQPESPPAAPRPSR